ncbi:Uncharacterised protein [Mycobacteroides abscessus subsp. abscessus]|nr:Uncharacterised protein [Mycobacteroides abscessus subsp. abscessus]
MSLAIFNASSNESNFATDSTGPKISSWKMRMLLVPANTVGWMYAPSGYSATLRASPPVSTCAPSCRPISMYDKIFSYWSLLACAPIMVSSSSGSPPTIASTRVIARAMNSS